MRRHLLPSFAVLLIAAGVLLFYAVKPAQTQDDSLGWYPPEDREAARAILTGGAVRYLSGSGVNALRAITGASAPSGSIQRGGVAAPPYASNRFEVMVNDPAQDILADQDISIQSETSVAGYGNNIVVAFNDSLGFIFPNRSAMGYAVSADGGMTFTDRGFIPTTPTGFNDGDPGVAADRSGNFYVSSISYEGSRPAGTRYTVGINKSVNGGQTFGPPVYVPATGLGPNSFQDKMFIEADATGGPFNGRVYVSFTSFPASYTGQLPIMVSRSENGGVSFQPAVQVSAVGTTNQGSEPAVGPAGEVYVAWYQFTGPGGPGIVLTKSTDGGASFLAANRRFVAPALAAGFESGSMFGNFRVNSFPRIDVDQTNGNVYIVYAARTLDGDAGNVYFVRSTDGGATWSAPLRINGDPGKNDQVFPDVAVNGQGVIRVTWYDKRHDPQNLRIAVFGATSKDGGLSFGPNTQISLGSFLPGVGYDPAANPIYMGDYNDIKAIRTNAGRGSDLLFAWTDCRRVVESLSGRHPDQDVFFTRLR